MLAIVKKPISQNIIFWPKSKPWKIADTSSTLQTRGLVTSVSCSSSDSSNEIKEEMQIFKILHAFFPLFSLPAVFSPVSKKHQILSINFGFYKD